MSSAPVSSTSSSWLRPGRDGTPRLHRCVGVAAVLLFAFLSQSTEAGQVRGEVEPDTPPVVGPEEQRASAAVAVSGEATLGGWLLLDGSGSKSPRTGALRYHWRQIGGPTLPLFPGQDAEAKLWLYLARAGEFRFLLVVEDDVGLSDPAEATFSVGPGALPAPEDQLRQTAGWGERVDLPGEGWRQVHGTPVSLARDGAVTHFRPPSAGLFIFEAPRAGELPERRGVFVPSTRDGQGNRRPVAELPRELRATAGTPLIIDGIRSFDQDPGETEQLTARWSCPDKGRGVELTSLGGLKTRFTATRPGDYVVTLVVSDGRLDSRSESVVIHVDAAGSPGVIDPTLVGEGGSVVRTDRDDMLQRPVSIGLWGNLDRAVQLFPSRCGVALRIDPDLYKPEQFELVPLALESVKRPLRHLADGIARQAGGVYRREAGSGLWLTHPLGWTGTEKLLPVMESVDALFTQRNGADLSATLVPVFGAVARARPGANLAFEPPHHLAGMLPETARTRLKEVLTLLRVPSARALPPLEASPALEAGLRQMLAETRVTFSKNRQRLDYLLIRDLAQESGLAVGFDPRQFPDGLPNLDVEFKDRTLRDVIRELVERGGFDGCSVEPPNGLWFYRGPQPFPNAELLWDQAVVRAYDLDWLLEQPLPLTGEVIAHLVRQRVYAASWKEPGVGVFFHAPTRKLVVIHAPEAQRAVLELLYDLAERGEAALGPEDAGTPTPPVSPATPPKP